jgi:hypothetical protein
VHLIVDPPAIFAHTKIKVKRSFFRTVSLPDECVGRAAQVASTVINQQGSMPF